MKLFDKTTLKFFAVGIVNTIVGTSAMFLMYNVVHAGYWISSASNYIAGGIVSYILNKRFTFRSKERSMTQVLKFVANISICYFLAYGCAKPLARLALQSAPLATQENIAMLVGMGLYVLLNYFGQRFIVFRERD